MTVLDQIEAYDRVLTGAALDARGVTELRALARVFDIEASDDAPAANLWLQVRPLLSNLTERP